MIKIVVGSTSEHKINAVRDACEELCLKAEIVGFAAKSGVNEQPFGVEEMTRGAANRAHVARMPVHKKTERGIDICDPSDPLPDFAIGIESGVVKLAQDVFVDMAAVVLTAATRVPNGINTTAKNFYAVSAGHQVDASDVGIAMARGLDKHTVSSVTRERTGCSATDSTPHYTGGRVHRRELLAQAVKIAISQWLTRREQNGGAA